MKSIPNIRNNMVVVKIGSFNKKCSRRWITYGIMKHTVMGTIKELVCRTMFFKSVLCLQNVIKNGSQIFWMGLPSAFLILLNIALEYLPVHISNGKYRAIK